MKRKLKWMAVVLVVLLLGTGVAFFLWPRDKITRESCAKVRIGMTAEEVEAILGKSGKTYTEHLADFAGLENLMGEPIRGPCLNPNATFWLGRRGIIEITFERNLVANKIFLWIGPANPTFLDRLRDWLGW